MRSPRAITGCGPRGLPRRGDSGFDLGRSVAGCWSPGFRRRELADDRRPKTEERRSRQLFPTEGGTPTAVTPDVVGQRSSSQGGRFLLDCILGELNCLSRRRAEETGRRDRPNPKPVPAATRQTKVRLLHDRSQTAPRVGVCERRLRLVAHRPFEITIRFCDTSASVLKGSSNDISAAARQLSAADGDDLWNRFVRTVGSGDSAGRDRSR